MTFGNAECLFNTLVALGVFGMCQRLWATSDLLDITHLRHFSQEYVYITGKEEKK